MTEWLPPGALLVLGALAIPLLPRRVRPFYLVALPALGLWQVLALPDGLGPAIRFFDYTLDPLRVDALSRAFGIVFHLAALLCAIYALHIEDPLEHVAGLVYAGFAIAGVFAGDLLSLFVCWEGTALASVFLIWARRTEAAYRAGMRYLVIQIGSGVLLLAGALVHLEATGSLAFGLLGLDAPGGTLIFLAFGIKAAFPLLHNWLQDAYPEATVAGTVFLSAFTTKLAIYALARGFAGTEILVPIGAAMTAFPVFYAVIENDLRRVLAYSLNNQLGYMVVGIGIGSELALDGTVAHAFAHIIYKALLFMSMGAVLLRAGTIKASELGGLYRSMPWTTGFCIVGAISISAFPLTSGFVSKSLILTAAAEEHYFWTWLVLLAASAGVLKHSGIKIPYFAFFAHYSGRRVPEAPWNMRVAMGIAAALCLAIGVAPDPLYALLPYPVEYRPYTVEHVVTQLQLLVFAVLAFALLLRFRIYPPELRSINLDTDWLYRRPLRALAFGSVALGRALRAALATRLLPAVERGVRLAREIHAPSGPLGEPWPTGTTTFVAALVLGAYLLLYYL
jgi:multicomponent Na+:H+ antiporter subunit D